MPLPTPSRSQLEDAVTRHGLRLRGGWRVHAQDALPLLPGGEPAAVVWMVGVVGSEMWPVFKASPFFRDGQANPLDRWSQAIGRELAASWGGLALFPFDGPPYYPFQQWATRSEPLQSSRLMLRLHPEHGLWHAYRFALVLAAVVPGDLPPTQPSLAATQPDLCLSCDGQPCLQACPVQAYSGTAFKLEACAAHLHRPDGQACMQAGCLARRACPVGQTQAYSAEHAAFHMRAFTERH